VLRPRRSSNLLRVLVAAAGDLGVAVAALAIATFLRRRFELPLTRDLLPAENFALDLPTVLLFVLPLLLALELTGFYTVSSSPRHRPTMLFAVPLQVALVATAATFLGLLVPRSVLAMVALLELVLLPLWRRLVRRLVPLRRRPVALVGTAEELAAAIADEADLERAHLRLAALVPLDRPLDSVLFSALVLFPALTSSLLPFTLPASSYRLAPFVPFDGEKSIRCACRCALRISSVARKQWACDIAVSVRLTTSWTSCSP
jgi:hypothetical protein